MAVLAALGSRLPAQTPAILRPLDAVATADVWVTRQVRRPALVQFAPLHRGMEGLSALGGPGVVIATAVAPFHNNVPKPAAMVSAVVVSEVEVYLLKALVGRARPYATADTNARSFGRWRGLRSADFRSFPSAHSVVVYAFAGSLANQVKDRAYRPYIYGTAAAVGLSRIYLDKHWFTDVVVGAVLGKFNADLMNRHVRAQW